MTGLCEICYQILSVQYILDKGSSKENHELASLLKLKCYICRDENADTHIVYSSVPAFRGQA